ncbi:MAG: hypothetical protein RR090_05940 [Niameybacter sp.]|uniref:hypothetical protein n=1 Tax=Niameybacter sp. TaxID=2033640 RepID=UPI002FC9DEFB
MRKFACIYFNENNIIVSKDRLFKGLYPKITIDSIWYGAVESFKVIVECSYQQFTPKNWNHLENQLLERDVEYAYIQGIDKASHPFEEICTMGGQELLPLTSYYILKYIAKYKLIPENMLNAKIGIIAGDMGETLDVIRSVMDDITDLTLFAEQPLTYKEVVLALHQKKRLKVRVVKPNEALLNKMNIIFDLKLKGVYAKWCSPKAIYIDYKNKVERHMDQLRGTLPSIWYDFDIVWEGQLTELAILHMILKVQGFADRTLKREFKNLNIGIIGVHTRRIS